MPVHELLLAQQALLNTLAEAWLACGATSFSIWNDGRPLACWPDGIVAGPDALAAAIRIGRYEVGELRLTGLNDQRAQRRLQSEARLLARVLQLEGELEQMTSEMIETQDQLLAMYELTQATRSHLVMAEILRRLACESARLLKAQGAVLFLPPTLTQHPEGFVDERLLLNYLQRVQESGQELIRNDIDPLSAAGLENICVLPIKIRGSSKAALGLMNRAGGFASPDLKLAQAIAEQAGAQIEHTLLHQETLEQTKMQAEMEIARRVQLQLLPQKHPKVGCLNIFAESRPARQVGGDFYDFVAEPDRPLMVLIGDVAGKGVPAALIMGMIHAISRSAARFLPSPTPASVLCRTNNDLYDDLTMLESFATAFVAQYDLPGRILRYANAGHAPVIYRPAGGTARLVEGDGVPIGVLPISLSEDYTLDFGPGSLLVVTTDGFNEARSPSDEMFGYERLLHLVDEFADQPAQVIAIGLFDAVDLFAAGRSQDDDQTLVVIKGAV